MAPRDDHFSHAYRNFISHDPLKIRSSIRKCNKKILPLGTQHLVNLGGGGGGAGVGGATTVHSSIRKCNKKFWP